MSDERCGNCGHVHQSDGDEVRLLGQACGWIGGILCACTEYQFTIAALRAEVKQLNGRVAELLEANTREVLARRDAQAEAQHLRRQLEYQQGETP